MRAVIVYYSHTGRTAAYAKEMAYFLWQQGVSVSLCSTADFSPDKAAGADLLLLGCWTSGWFFIHQHPHAKWKAFAKSLPSGLQSRLLLFTTYLIRPGSMFKKMLQALPPTLHHSKQWRMASKTGRLGDADKQVLMGLVNDARQS